jgi:hypothetical protein
MKTLILLFFVSAALQVQADANSDALQKLGSLPSAPLVITMDQASGSPSVILTDKGAFINKSKTPVPFDHVLSTLAALPKEAWPYGRVLFFSASPVGLPGASAPPKAVADKVELDLQKANIRLLHAGG